MDHKLLLCQRCGYKWKYKGEAIYIASCPICKTSVSIKKAELLTKENEYETKSLY